MPPRSKADTSHPLPADFPISTMGGSLRSQVEVPKGDFDPAGDWTQQYAIFNNGPSTTSVGTLSIERRTTGGKVSLKIRHEKALSGSTGGGAKGSKAQRVLNAVLQLGPKPSRLSTPRRWSFTTKVMGADGSVIADAGLKRTASVEDGELKIATGDAKPRTVELAGDYTLSWALFDAVARLPREKFDPIDFTLIDHFDQVKPDHRLLYRGDVETTLGNTKSRLHAYDELGRGIMPVTHFVDAQGRVALVISGLEAYVLRSQRS